MSKTVALSLGSGGARGYTHIGVIEALEERGYEIKAISGCSIGALVGGFYCAGKLGEYRKWVEKLKYLDMIKLMDISLLSSGMIRGDKIFNVIDEMLGDTQIEDLELPFTAVATDLTDQKEIWFQDGLLSQAIRASAAIPGMFSPVEVNGHLMVDGAVLNPLPITPCVSSHADLIIAVDLSADVPNLPDLVSIVEKASETKEEKSEWYHSFLDKAAQWVESRGLKIPEKEQREQLGKLGVLNRVVDVMSASLTQYKVAGYPPDLLIKIPRDCCDTYEFYRASEMIYLGKRIAHLALDAYEQGYSSLYGQR
ncbi:MAG: patatin-like phospholipase family protein [Venatoribacter sp.]